VKLFLGGAGLPLAPEARCRWSICLSVCLSVCRHAYLKNQMPQFGEATPSEKNDGATAIKHHCRKFVKFDSAVSEICELTDRQTNKPAGDLVRAPPLSNFRELPFRNKRLNQNSVETLYAGNVGLHYTKISENWIKNCRRSSISREPLNYDVFSSQSRR